MQCGRVSDAEVLPVHYSRNEREESVKVLTDLEPSEKEGSSGTAVTAAKRQSVRERDKTDVSLE